MLVRDIPPDDLDMIRLAAAEQGMSVQSYLRQTLRAQAAYLRRQATLSGIERRLEGRPVVPEGERAAVLAEIAAEQDRRADDLGGGLGQ